MTHWWAVPDKAVNYHYDVFNSIWYRNLSTKPREVDFLRFVSKLKRLLDDQPY